MKRVEIEATEAMKQASMTADQYLRDAFRQIDAWCGKGYAEKHPELVVAFMRTAAQDFHTTCTTAAIQDAVAELKESAEDIKEAIVGVSDILERKTFC